MTKDNYLADRYAFGWLLFGGLIIIMVLGFYIVIKVMGVGLW